MCSSDLPAGQPGGITGMVLLAESHVAIHTWPELQAVTLDIYVCNFSRDNTTSAEKILNLLLQAFNPTSPDIRRLNRGDLVVTDPPAG